MKRFPDNWFAEHSLGLYVAHVAKGYEERELHIQAMAARQNLPFEYMLAGDIPSITAEVRQRWHVENLTDPQTSCALKHLYIYDEIQKRGQRGALVLEDDIMLSSHFVPVFLKAMEEMEGKEQRPLIISFEDTLLRFVPRSRRQKGRVLYPGERDRATGAYFINAAGAKAVSSYALERGLNLPIDLLHSEMIGEGRLEYLWCQPTVATQGSHLGIFASGIDKRDKRWKHRTWRLQRLYKRLLYFLR